jgi:hypothetical protein
MSLAVAQMSAAQPASPGAPPHVLNIVRVKVKPKSAAAYGALEAQISRAYDRAKARVYWICLQARDASDVLYLNLHDSPEDAERMVAAYRDAVRLHPELTALTDRLAEMTASSTSTMTTRRDDVDRVAPGVDFARLHTIRVTTFDVRPGREGDFLKAIRTTSAKEGSWLVYEANEASTFMLLTLTRTASGRHSGPAVPRAVRRLNGVYGKADTRLYQVRPAMSHVSQAFIAANPQLWRGPAPTH